MRTGLKSCFVASFSLDFGAVFSYFISFFIYFASSHSHSHSNRHSHWAFDSNQPKHFCCRVNSRKYSKQRVTFPPVILDLIHFPSLVRHLTLHSLRSMLSHSKYSNGKVNGMDQRSTHSSPTASANSSPIHGQDVKRIFEAAVNVIRNLPADSKDCKIIINHDITIVLQHDIVF